MKNHFSFRLVAGELAAVLTVALFAGYLPSLVINSFDQDGETPFAVSEGTAAYIDASELTAAGLPADTVLDDGTIATNLTATASISKYTIRNWMNWVKWYRPVIYEIVINSNNVASYKREMRVQQLAPKGGGKEDYILLDSYYSRQQQNNDKIVIDLRKSPLKVNFDTYLDFQIGSNEEVTITYYYLSKNDETRYLETGKMPA